MASAAALAADSKRYEKSLGLLTMRFVSLLRKAKDGILDLKHASNLLAVTQKRRIYDITNVLEGIGLIAKKSKNSVQWKGSLSESNSKNMSKKVKNLRRQLNRLNAHECMLDQQIRWITQSTKNVLDEQTNQDLLYVVQNDVRRLFSNSDQVVVLEASLGTGLAIHVPTPENYTLHVKSRNAVDVVLLCDAEDEKQKQKELDDSADKEVELFMNAYEEEMLKNRLCRLSPPVTKMDFIFSLNNSEGLCDLFDIPC